MNTEIVCVYFSIAFIPSVNGNGGNKNFINMITRTTQIVNHFITLRCQIISVLLFKQGVVLAYPAYVSGWHWPSWMSYFNVQRTKQLYPGLGLLACWVIWATSNALTFRQGGNGPIFLGLHRKIYLHVLSLGIQPQISSQIRKNTQVRQWILTSKQKEKMELCFGQDSWVQFSKEPWTDTIGTFACLAFLVDFVV